MSAVKILAADDEPDFELLVTQRFRRQIRDKEFEFRFAHHGEEALAILSAEPDIDLLLLDINMPVMDGLTLLNRLRKQRSEVRTIMVSAYGDMTNLRTAMNRGAFDFVTGRLISETLKSLYVRPSTTLPGCVRSTNGGGRQSVLGATWRAIFHLISRRCWLSATSHWVRFDVRM